MNGTQNHRIMKKNVCSKIRLVLLLFSFAVFSISCGSDDADPSTQVPIDTDGDGVADIDDTCPNEAGLATLGGCPDADGDGVADMDDACPNEAGVAALDGCPDADGDGIADMDDACPNDAGLPALDGCPDADGDGIIDMDDACPNEAGVAELDGCPVEPDAEESIEPVGPTLLKINSGGDEVTIGAETFLADQYFTGITETFVNPFVTEIENTDLDEIYLSERITIESSSKEPFSYEIPVSNGTYTVKLYFAEIFWGVTNPQMLDGGEGSRLFGIKMEEMTIINSFDVFKSAEGAAKAITKMYDVEVNDGVLTITFQATVDRPKISAIEVFGNGTIDP